MKKRVLSLVLVVAMLFTMLPITALAANYTDTVAVGGTITLTTDSWFTDNHNWTVEDTDIATISGSSTGSSVSLTGVTEGTTTVTHTYTNWRGSEQTDTWTITVTAASSGTTSGSGTTSESSTVTFRIVNGTWNNLSFSNEASVGAGDTEVTFTVTWDDTVNGYVYKCGGDMESFLNAILGGDNSFGSGYIVPDQGYTLDGLSNQDWAVESGGLTNSTADANGQMTAIQGNIHGYDDHMTPTGGFVANTVYVLTLTKSDFYVDGEIDNGGTVQTAAIAAAASIKQTLKYEAASEAMVFTPAAGYEITGITEYINNATTGTPIDLNNVAADGTYTYPVIDKVVSDVKVVVTTALKTYTVTWVNDDGETVLEQDTNVTHGSTPSYDGDTPTKASDAQYNYTFAGWTPAIAPVTADVTYTATYTPTIRTYTVTWVDYKRDVIETDANVPYGTVIDFDTTDEVTDGAVRYDGTTPTRPDDAAYSYTFSGWNLYEGTYDATSNTVTGDVAFQAVFNSSALNYTATVEVVLDGTFTGDTVSGGTKIAISTVESGAEDAIYLRKTDGTGDYIKLTGSDGVYSNSAVPNGEYYIYILNGSSYEQVGTQLLVINNADRTRYLPYYSVTYDAGEATAATNMPASPEYYYIGEHVDVSTATPAWDEHHFLNWLGDDNNTYMPTTALETVHLTDSITKAYVLTAQWEATVKVNVTVNVTHGDDNSFYTNPLNIHLTYAMGSSTNYAQYPDSLKEVESAEWFGTPATAPEKTTYTGTSYTDLAASYAGEKISYSADASLVGYKQTNIATTYNDDTNTYNVVIDLEFDPVGFELEYTVRVVDTPEAMVPGEVDVKVLYSTDGTTWKPIAEHENSSMAVTITKNGDTYSGTGSTHVWGIDTNNNPYKYTIAIAGVDGIGSNAYEIPMTGTYPSYTSSEHGFFPAGAYTGTVSGSASASVSETGTTQSGIIVGIVSGKAYNIVLHNGEETFAAINNRLTVPTLETYAPTKDSETFVGWNTKADGSGTTLTGGEFIKDYVSTVGGTLDLYAQWAKNLTVAGTVTVKLGCDCSDTSRSTTVMLQWKDPDSTTYSYYRTLSTAEVTLENGTGDYEFTNLDPTKDYRILVNILGGTVTYQNEANTDYGAGNYEAVDVNPVDNTAIVNVLMVADHFDLAYEVDATAIGAGYRPTDVTIGVLHDHSIGSYAQFGSITVDDLADGEETGKVEHVPPYHANGYLYNYVLSTISYKVLGKEVTEHKHHLNDVAAQKTFAPFVIHYEGPANAVANGTGGYGQDVTLLAEFIPNVYDISYNLNNGYWKDVTPVTQHTWSYTTDLSKMVPIRDGYTFLGWTADVPANYDAATNTIPASVWTDVKLTANWEKDVWKDAEKTPENDEDSETGGDGIPDQYQVLVKYTAGTGGTVSPTLEVITIGENATSGNVTAAGSTATADTANDYVFDSWTHEHTNATIVNKYLSRTGEIKIENAQGGSTYTFNASFAIDVKGEPDPQKIDESDDTADKYQAFVEFHSADANGTVTTTDPNNTQDTGIRQTTTFPENATSGDVTPSLDNITVKPAEGYALDIWTQDSSNTPVVPTTTLTNVPGNTVIKFYAHFAEDKLEDPTKDPDPETPGDGIPDKYQVTVTYKVINGYLDASKTANEKKVVFTLYEKDATTGVWKHVYPVPVLGDTIPTEMVPDDTHIGTGKWNAEINAETMVDGNVTYTYTFGTAIAPSISVEKTANRTSVVVGEEVIYTIKVKNNGNIDLTDLTVTETFGGDLSKAKITLPDGVEKVSASEYLIESLKMDETVTITISYVATDADATVGELTNSVKVESKDKYDTTPDDPEDEDKPVTGEDQTDDVPVEPQKPGLNVTKDTSQTYVSAGETVIWTITVSNTGNTALTDITLVDTLYADGWESANLDLRDASGNVVTSIANLAVGQSVKLYAEYTVSEDDVNKTLSNTVVATTPNNGPSDEGESGDTYVIVPEEPTKPELNDQDHVAYIIGYTDVTVRPTKNITRAETATIFFRLLTNASRTHYWSKVNNYTDVQATDWFNNAISTLTNAGILTGYDDGTFRPNEPITRAEFAAMAARFSDVVYNGSHSFTDVEAGHWASRYIALAEYLGWVEGYPDHTFRPDQDITRGEAMTLINRVLKRAVEEEHMLPDMVHWIDNIPGNWYYEAVQEATNSHTYDRLDKVVPEQDFCYEDWLTIRAVPDWAALEKQWSEANDQPEEVR